MQILMCMYVHTYPSDTNKCVCRHVYVYMDVCKCVFIYTLIYT